MSSFIFILLGCNDDNVSDVEFALSDLDALAGSVVRVGDQFIAQVETTLPDDDAHVILSAALNAAELANVRPSLQRSRPKLLH